MKCGVVVFPASNGDMDMHYVLKDIMKCDTKFLWHKDKLPPEIDFRPCALGSIGPCARARLQGFMLHQ